MCIAALAVACLGFADKPVGILAALALYGAGREGLTLSLTTLTALRVAKHKRGRAMSFIHLSRKCADVLGPILGGVLVLLLPLRAAVILAALPALVCAPLLWFGMANTPKLQQPTPSAGTPSSAASSSCFSLVLACLGGAWRDTRVFCSLLRQHARKLLVLAGYAMALTMARQDQKVLPTIKAAQMGIGPGLLGVALAVRCVAACHDLPPSTPSYTRN